MKDVEKRKRVMQRSARLGHCICDPKKSCPCDVFREKDICPCAGERLEEPSAAVRLTDLADRPGCASKIDEASLKRVLRGLPEIDDPRVLVGVPAGDDAGVYRLDGELALVQTVDVFSPSVDDPYLFGQIAAANSVSDVYAMGARPITALSIVGFPIREVPDRVMHEILRGGIDKMAEAGVAVIGGHSINDPQIKAGFAVTGLVHPERIVTNAGARPGDRLILTKPIGTGIIAFAAQIGRAPEGATGAAGRAMAALNRRASELMSEFAAHACTDVTGFGLMGHLGAMAAASKVDVEIVWDEIPMFPGVLECAAEGILPGAIERNRESSARAMLADDGLSRAMLDVCFDAQTSGGLLVALPESAAEAFLGRLHEEGVSDATEIGRVLTRGPGRVHVRYGGGKGVRNLLPERPEGCFAQEVPDTFSAAARACCPVEESDKVGGCDDKVGETAKMGCCDDEVKSDAGETTAPGGESADAGGAREAEQKFQDFMKAANAPGALDAATKQAIAVALSVLARCEPCVKSHLKKARQMGFTQEQIDEAAAMAVEFGGCPSLMFYKQFRHS